MPGFRTLPRRRRPDARAVHEKLLRHAAVSGWSWPSVSIYISSDWRKQEPANLNSRIEPYVAPRLLKDAAVKKCFSPWDFFAQFQDELLQGLGLAEIAHRGIENGQVIERGHRIRMLFTVDGAQDCNCGAAKWFRGRVISQVLVQTRQIIERKCRAWMVLSLMRRSVPSTVTRPPVGS